MEFAQDAAGETEGVEVEDAGRVVDARRSAACRTWSRPSASFDGSSWRALDGFAARCGVTCQHPVGIGPIGVSVAS
ncbi:hypothetical protein [Streptomyces sp. NPDC056628]|uniref:hypothetical protein n=1 Tax=Streptomyces sp. NPDC056628 TaxID=3345882 RepID=UPI0036927719